MNQLSDLLVENGLRGDVWTKDVIIAERLLSPCINQSLIADFLPHILILVILSLLCSKWLDSHSYVDLAFNHLTDVISFNFEY